MRKKQVFEIADRVIGTATDITLLMLYSLIGAAGAGSSSSIQVGRSMREAQTWIDDVNYETIKHALYNLSQKKFIRRMKKFSRNDIEITELGWKRIK